MAFVPAELIKKKRDNKALSDDELQFLIQSYVEGRVQDDQMAAFLMAVFFRGMNEQETLTLTRLMLESGRQIDLSQVKSFKCDKHSTGGVGDKTSLILGPLVAACGVAVPMISGRGLGHTGGTVDKMESIPGFSMAIAPDAFVRQMIDFELCFSGQTPDICPADRKMYALRDVTATVESLPLICASILSKKLAEGIDGLVLDVKFGSGAFMKTAESAEALAQLLMKVARLYGKKVATLLTDMNQPLGQFAGNSLEVEECLAIMRGERNPMMDPTRDLSLQLSARMLVVAGRVPTFEAGMKLATETLESGAALKKFEELCARQGGRLKDLPKAKYKKNVIAKEKGMLATFDTEGVGYAGIMLKAGRLKTGDPLDLTAGIEFHKKLGDDVREGDVLFTLYGNDENLFSAAEDRLLRSVTYSLQKVTPPTLILKTLT